MMTIKNNKNPLLHITDLMMSSKSEFKSIEEFMNVFYTIWEDGLKYEDLDDDNKDLIDDILEDAESGIKTDDNSRMIINEIESLPRALRRDKDNKYLYKQAKAVVYDDNQRIYIDTAIKQLKRFKNGEVWDE